MTLWNYGLNELGATHRQGGTGTGTLAPNLGDANDLTYVSWGSYGSYWLSCDLGAPQYIEQIRLLQQAAGFLSAWYLQTSVDGSIWTTRLDVSTPAYDYTFAIGGITARYFRLLKTAAGNGPGQKFYTVQYLGPIEAPPPPTSPEPDYIAAWLDGLNANYVPGVRAWLDANGY